MKVKVSQESDGGQAVGFIEGGCVSGSQINWQIDVSAPDAKSFTAGPAVACGHLIVHATQASSFEKSWCKNVVLQ
jgi:hypothetical protein